MTRSNCLKTELSHIFSLPWQNEVLLYELLHWDSSDLVDLDVMGLCRLLVHCLELLRLVVALDAGSGACNPRAVSVQLVQVSIH